MTEKQTHTNTEAVSDADPVRLHVEAMQRMATAYLVPEPYIDLSGNRYPEPDFNHADHIKQELRNAMTMAFANDMLHMLDGPEQRAAFALSRRSASNTGGVEVRAVENALAMLSELQQERSDGAVYEDAVREKAGFYANVIRSLLAAVNSAQSKAASLNGLVSLALRELDALGAETVPVQIRNGLSVLSSLAAEAEPVAQGSCASCNGTGDTGGNPSYGMCPDCDGTGKFPPAHPSSSVSAEPVAHPDDLAVDQFAAAMKAKLAKKRGEGRSGWEDKEACSASFLSSLLHGHVIKGDPVDVANLAMMLHQRGETILQTPNSAEHDPHGATFVFGSRSSSVSAEVTERQADIAAATRILGSNLDNPWSRDLARQVVDTLTFALNGGKDRYDPAVEAEAKRIYDAMDFDGPPHQTKPAWVPRGNSHKQEEARRQARASINGGRENG